MDGMLGGVEKERKSLLEVEGFVDAEPDLPFDLALIIPAGEDMAEELVQQGHNK